MPPNKVGKIWGHSVLKTWPSFLLHQTGQLVKSETNTTHRDVMAMCHSLWRVKVWNLSPPTHTHTCHVPTEVVPDLVHLDPSEREEGSGQHPVQRGHLLFLVEREVFLYQRRLALQQGTQESFHGRNGELQFLQHFLNSTSQGFEVNWSTGN